MITVHETKATVLLLGVTAAAPVADRANFTPVVRATTLVKTATAVPAASGTALLSLLLWQAAAAKRKKRG